ncbi:MAG: fibronectin type III domain-containing protein [bacterium]
MSKILTASIVFFASIAVALSLSSCGGKNVFPAQSADGRFKAVAIAGVMDYSINLTETADGIRIELSAPAASDGFFVHIEYPEDSYEAKSAYFSRRFGDGYLKLAVLTRPGIAAIGVTRIGGGAIPAGEIAAINLVCGTSGERSISAAPSGPANVVTNLIATPQSADSIRFTWNGKNNGDYDAGGEVNVADITPIALNFLRDPNDGEGDDVLESLIDGDGSGDVGVSDITPIALNYLAVLSGYHIYRGVPSPPGEPVWNAQPLEIGIVPENSTVVPYEPGRDPQYGFFRFDVTVPVDPAFLSSSSAWRVVPTDGASEGTPSDYAITEPGDTTPPVWISGNGIESAVAGAGSALVTWGTAEDADSPPVTYRVYYGLSSEEIPPNAFYEDFGSNTHSALITGLDLAEYAFFVTALDSESPPNENTSGGTLFATPFDALATVPPATKTQVSAVDADACDIALAPESALPPVPMEPGAPVIAYAEPGGALNIAYYKNGWQEEQVSPGSAGLGAPDVFFAGGQVLIAVPDATAGSISLFYGLPGQGFAEALVTDAALGANSLKAAYSPGGDIAIAYSAPGGGGDAEVRYAFAPYTGGSPDGLSWNFETIGSQPTVVSVALDFDPADGSPVVVYTGGQVDSQTFAFDTSAFRAARLGTDSWSVSDLASQLGDVNPLAMSAAFVEGEMEITYQKARSVTVPSVGDLPVFDLSVWRGGASPVNKTFVSGSISLIGLFPPTVGITYGLVPAIVSIPSGSSKDAWIGAVTAHAEVNVSAFPALSGAATIDLEASGQTGSNVPNAADVGLGQGRGLAAEFGAGKVQAAFLETGEIDLSTLEGLLNLPAGPVVYAAVVP